MEVVGLAGGAAILVALVAVLLVLGAPGFVRLFDATVGRLPLVGSYIGGYVRAALNVATSGLRAWADSAAWPLVTTLFYVVTRPWALLNQLVNTTGALVLGLGRVAARLSRAAVVLGARITTEVAARVAAVAAAVASLGALARHLYNLAIAYTVAKVGQVANLARHLYNLSVAYTVAKVGALGVRLATEVDARVQADLRVAAAAATALGATATSLEGRIAQVAAQDAAALGALAGTLPGLATAAVAPAVAAEVDQLGQALHDLVLGPWEALVPEVEAIAVGLGVDVASAIPGLGGLTGALPASLTGILALLVPALAATATETARCTVPLCENLGGLSNLLQSILTEASLVALFGAVAYAATHPTQAAEDLENTLGGPVADLARTLESLMGVG